MAHLALLGVLPIVIALGGVHARYSINGTYVRWAEERDGN